MKARPAKAEYELAPSVGNGKGFRAKGGATVLQIIGPNGEPPKSEVRCTAVKGDGKLALPNLLTDVVLEFKGCAFGIDELRSKANCQSASKKGVIVTDALAGEMVDIEGGSGVGSLLEAEAGSTAPLATFTCREIGTLNLLGSVIAEHTGDIGVISKEAQDHFVVGPGLGQIEGKGRHGQIIYTPLVNIPTHKTGGAAGEHFLSAEITEAGQTEPFGTIPVGQEATLNEKGEALMITP